MKQKGEPGSFSKAAGMLEAKTQTAEARSYGYLGSNHRWMQEVDITTSATSPSELKSE
jgi:hypothetical protein